MVHNKDWDRPVIILSSMFGKMKGVPDDGNGIIKDK